MEGSLQNVTPYSSLAGGALIGLAVTVLLLWNGRLAGVSGIVAGVLAPSSDGRIWRALFTAGLVVGCLGVRVAGGDAVGVTIEASTPRLVLAGLLVGYGTRMGNGCTSGHGVCGLARLSLRSLVATATFMAAGAITVFVVRHMLGGA